MLRHHYSPAPLIDVRPREQKPEPGYKPLGFWYEVDGDWRRWCEQSEVGWLTGTTRYRVELGEERILRLRGGRALDRFTSKYGVPDEGSPSPRFLHFAGIDWQRIAESFDGIEIAPYVWSRRLSLMWYYGWDCASGCIWRPRGVRLIEEGEGS